MQRVAFISITAEMRNNSSSKAYPMNAGSDLYSYSKNSTYQKGAIDAVKDLINEEIPGKLDIQNLSSPHTIRIVDMGCSIGPNTFIAMQNIIEALYRKYQGQGINSELLEIQVFLNDHATNDFNTLFNSLTPNMQYYVVGVPGSFYGALFPNASVNIVHSSYALQWLSQVPKQIVDKTSPAWNRGVIFYSSERYETVKAFAEQFGKDMDCFLHFRAKEVVSGGLMILVILGRSDETPHSQVDSNIAYNLLGSCLADMARKGIISEDKVDSFNIPIYLPCPKEVEETVEQNGHFSIERLECITHKKSKDNNNTAATARLISSHVRAGMGLLLEDHFGHDIMDGLFDSFSNKLENPGVFHHGKAFTLFILLKRKLVN